MMPASHLECPEDVLERAEHGLDARTPARRADRLFYNLG
jgi:hypothetical protein